MVTRKTASKSNPVKTAKTAKTAAKPVAKAEGKATAPVVRKRTVEATPKKPRATAAGTPAMAAKATAPAQQTTAEVPTGEARYRWIAHAAYLRAERRGFAPGHEVDDWLAAEAEFAAAHGAN